MGSDRLEPVLLAAADLPPGAVIPARLALVRIEDGDEARSIEWPGTRAEFVRRFARTLPGLVCGGSAQTLALALWLDRLPAGIATPPAGSITGGASAPLLSLDPLARRAGLPPNVRSSVRRRRTDDDAGDPWGGDETPLERCRRLIPALVAVLANMRLEGVASWEEAAHWALDRPSFDFPGRAFDRSTLRELPDVPGVYRFHDLRGDLVYVGQSRSLRSRVSSYFRSGLEPSSRQGRIAARVHRIEVVAEGSDLAAQVREASEIRRLRPEVNAQRKVHARAGASLSIGARVVVLPGKRGSESREVFFLRDGEVIDRRRMSPDEKSRRRATIMLARHYFERPVQLGLPLPTPHRRRSIPGRPGISRRSAEEAARLLASWQRRRAGSILSFDPTDSPDPADAARRLLGYLAADPSEGPVFIR